MIISCYRYGRVQRVQRLDATHVVVSFTEVRAAQKAHADDAKHALRTSFYEQHNKQ